MLNFESDYTTGAHPRILERFVETNLIPQTGYGADEYSKSAAEKILKAADCPEGEVFFISGGTQTNALVVSAVLEPFEGAVSAVTGHIHAHESGAVEYTGHKVIGLPGYEGKIKASDLRDYVETFYADANHEHMVFPGLVYISHPTEYGTLYTKQELTEISEVCRAFNMTLFLDGARLYYGLMSLDTDVTLQDIARLTDVFYIGGTKCGALLGEAVVFTKHNTPKHFVNIIKKHGALLAKGRAIGVQFDTLFTDGLIEKIAKNAIDLAEELKKILREKGYRFLLNSPTNQQFVILENTKMEELKKAVRFGFWEKVDDTHTAVRFATSWSTTAEDIRELEKLL